jgi:Peptidase_C39 like family
MLALAFATASFASIAGSPSAQERATLTTGFFVQLKTYDDPVGATPNGATVIDATARGLVLHPSRNDTTSAIEFELEETPPFRELFASWNIETPPGTGFAIEVRVGEKRGAELSPWLWLGDWGEIPAVEKLRKCAAGRVDVDVFVAERDLCVWQLRMRAFRMDEGTQPLRVRRIDACVANRTLTMEDASKWAPRTDRAKNTGCSMGGPEGPRPLSGPIVPFRSQRAEDPAIAGRICSPTSVAMVLAYRGIDLPTAEVAARIYDHEHAMYGNWSRAIQGAFSFGVAGYLTRVATWDEARAFVLAGQPLVISIAAEPGELTGAPYAKTDGHLLVLRGFETNGDVLVNDPAAQDAEHGVTMYSRAELERCWMGHGGVAYVLLPCTKDAEAADKPR